MFFQLYSLLRRACFAREGLKNSAGVPQKMYPKSQHSGDILRGRKAAWIAGRGSMERGLSIDAHLNTCSATRFTKAAHENLSDDVDSLMDEVQ